MLMTILGSLTAIMSGSCGVVQSDMKKVIAFSTASQLGYMVMISGLTAYMVSIFHLANHAIFKALLFLGAGSVIHAMSDQQDLRRMGGLLKLLPLTYVSMLIGSLALIGTPFLTGFYSKDLILEIALGSYMTTGLIVHNIGVLTAVITAFYS